MATIGLLLYVEGIVIFPYNIYLGFIEIEYPSIGITLSDSGTLYNTSEFYLL